MKTLASITVEHIIQNLNKAGLYLKKEWAAHNYASLPFAKFEVDARLKAWNYELEDPEFPIMSTMRQKYDGNDLIVYFGSLSGQGRNKGYSSIVFSPQYAEILFKDLAPDIALRLSQELAELYLKNKFKLKVSQYQKLYETKPKQLSKPTSYEKLNPQQIKTKMRTALRNWIATGNQLHAIKEITALLKYMPSEVSEYHEQPLYRGVIVAATALQKCLKQDKSLTYHSREYSSWTPDIETAEYFAKDYQGAQNGYIPAVLTKVFKPSQIVVDVRKLRKFLGFKTVFPLHEIIVKLEEKELEFTKNDIHEYMNQKDQWTSPHAEIEKELSTQREQEQEQELLAQQKKQKKIDNLITRLKRIVPEIRFELQGTYKDYGQLAVQLIPHFPKNFSEEDKTTAFHKIRDNHMRIYDYHHGIWTILISK